MMILLIAITILLGIVCSISLDDWDFFGVMCVFADIEIGILAILLGFVINGRVIDNKIKMYQEENVKIENQIEVVVKEYMKFEKETFIDLKTKDSYITLITIYPDLKSNTLVSKQIEVYLSNNNKIKQLKEDKINVSNYKWWVYFGK